MNKLEEYKKYEAEGKAAYIPMEDLIPYFYYRIHARNAEFGIWIPYQKGFYIRRQKFGDYFGFIEYHWDTGPPYGTVKPLKQLEDTLFTEEDFDIGNGEKGWHGEKNYYGIMKYLREKPDEYEHER